MRNYAGLAVQVACLALSVLIAGCSLPLSRVNAIIPPPAEAAPVPTATPVPATEPATRIVPTLAPTATLPPDIQPVTATIWSSDPQAPVLLYHHFVPDSAKANDTHIRLTEFRKELQTLYDDGYSLVPLGDWLRGDLTITPGRRPLILTIDDLFFADQVFLQPDGTPEPDTGIGVLWQFYKAHPDFGFAVALFANLGDKKYANISRGNGTFTFDLGWEDSLARTIAWCIDHGAIPYNHFFRHPFLTKLTPDQITAEARDNDLRLKDLLDQAGRADLFDRIDNILALPYGYWPKTPEAVNAVTNYRSPQGNPVLGIVEVGGIYAGHYLRAVYSPQFDANHLPRMVGSTLAMGYLTSYRNRFPVGQKLDLGYLDLNQLRTTLTVQAALESTCHLRNYPRSCPDGVYSLLGRMYRKTGDSFAVLWDGAKAAQ